MRAADARAAKINSGNAKRERGWFSQASSPLFKPNVLL
jgi:hypothetical protein